MNRRFLLVLLLCWPFVSMAADATYNAQNLTNAISNAKDINAAGTAYQSAVDAAVTNYPKASDDAKKSAKDNATSKVETAKNTSTKAMTAEDKAKADEAKKKDIADKEKTAAEAQKKYEDAKAKEQSTENKTLTALTTAATGLGAMELAQGLSEKKADEDAEADMRNYIATFRCSYVEGKSVKAGPEEIELPGGNDKDLMKYRSEYLALAKDLKERKEALGMKPGIEAEEILDKAKMGLYDDEFVGITSGEYASLYRAQMLGSAEDQAKIDSAKSATSKRVKGGAIALGAGVLGGVLGNSLINGKLGEKLKAAKDEEMGKEIKKLLSEEEKAFKSLQNCLKTAGVKGTDNLEFKNLYVSILNVSDIKKCKDIRTANGKEFSNEYANDLFADDKDPEKILTKLLSSFDAKTVSALVGANVDGGNADPTAEQKENAIKSLKNRIEKRDKQFEEAAKKGAEAQKDSGSTGSGGLSSLLGSSGGGIDISSAQGMLSNLGGSKK